jgi:hypothetical protein
MADPKLYGKDVGKLLDLQKELGVVEKSLSKVENEWMELQEQWEQSQEPEQQQVSNG